MAEVEATRSWVRRYGVVGVTHKSKDAKRMSNEGKSGLEDITSV
jgi:hypothetical protein